MKKALTVIMLIILTQTTYSQIGVGSVELVKLKAGKFTSEALSKLKSSKTVFIYREKDDLKELEKAIRGVWSFTEISFLPYSKLGTIDAETTSIFSIGGVNTNTKNMSSGLNYDNTHIYLSLWMQAEGKKGRKLKESYCRVELHPTYHDYSRVLGYLDKPEMALTYLYGDADLKNWNVGFLKNYLKNVNDLLTNKTERWLYRGQDKKTELKHLKTKTLYIPDYSLVFFNMYTGDESQKIPESKLFKSYPFKYKIISTDELSKKIIDSNEPFYYMVYVKSSTDKYVTVYNSKTGEIVYSKYKTMSYNLKNSDFKDLAKAINKNAN